MKFYKNTLTWVSHILSGLIIFFAILYTMSRLLTPMMSHYLPNIEVWASNTLQVPTKIERAFISWNIFEPELTLDGVKILNKTTHQPMIDIKQIKIDLSILRSLLSWKPMLNEIKIVGADLSIQEEKSEKFNFANLHFSLSDNFTGASIQTSNVLNWIVSQPHLSLENVNIHFVPLEGSTENITINRLVLHNPSDTHTLLGDAVLHLTSPLKIGVQATWHGNVNDFSHVSADLSLTVSGATLPERIKKIVWQGWQIKNGAGHCKVWATWKENAWQRIESNFKFHDLSFYSINFKQDNAISSLGGDVVWERQGLNQIITGQDILIKSPKHIWAPLDFSVILIPNQLNQLSIKNIQASYLYLSDFVSWLLMSKLLPDNISNLLKSFSPQGQINNLSIDFPQDNGQIRLEKLHLAAELQNISFHAVDDYPAIQNLTGQFNWSENQGHLQLNSQNLLFSYQKIFSNALRFDQVKAQLTLNKNADKNWDMRATEIQLINRDINVDANLELVLRPQSSAFIDLNSDFSVHNVEHINLYLPLNIFNSYLKNWLNTAFKSGYIESGKARVYGNLKDFPFEHGNGKFIISNQVKALNLDYATGWPLLTQLSGELIFNGSSMNVNAASGYIYDLPITHVKALISNLMGAEPLLEVQGMVHSDLSKSLYFLHHSPLEETIGSSLAEVNLSGPMFLQLNLVIPLVKPEKTHIKGELSTTKARMILPAWRLSLDNLEGVLQFDENSMSAKALRARLFGEDIQLELSTPVTLKTKRTLRARFKSQINTTTLEKWLGISFYKIMNGMTYYQAELDFPMGTQDQPVQMNFDTDLKGIVINAPVPYGKLADQQRMLKLQMFIGSDQPLKLKVNYENLISAAISVDNENNQFTIQGGEVHLGEGNADWQRKPGLIITGHLNQFDWDNWKNYFDSLNINNFFKNKSEDESISSWQEVNVFIDQFIIFGQQLNKIKLQLYRLPSAIRLMLNNNELEGEVILPISSKEIIEANFKRLYFSSDMINSTQKKWEPNSFPAMSFYGRDVRYNDKKLGELKLDIEPSLNGMVINNLQMNSSDLKLSGEGTWELNTDHYKTYLQGQAVSNHVSNLLVDWGYAEPNFVSGKGTADFDLNWDDAPYNPSFTSLSGKLSLKLGEGRIVDLGEKSAQLGLGRMLSIFNLQTIPRRLSLNFSDLVEKGYSFDYVIGDFVLKKGDAFTDDMLINGPIARVDVNGRIGLAQKDFDVKMSVTPYVTSSLPVVATIATGFNPIAGVATWFVDKMISKEVSKMTTYQYRVVGPWSKPVWEDVSGK